MFQSSLHVEHGFQFLTHSILFYLSLFGPEKCCVFLFLIVYNTIGGGDGWRQPYPWYIDIVCVAFVAFTITGKCKTIVQVRKTNSLLALLSGQWRNRLMALHIERELTLSRRTCSSRSGRQNWSLGVKDSKLFGGIHDGKIRLCLWVSCTWWKMHRAENRDWKELRLRASCSMSSSIPVACLITEAKPPILSYVDISLFFLYLYYIQYF